MPDPGVEEEEMEEPGMEEPAMEKEDVEEKEMEELGPSGTQDVWAITALLDMSTALRQLHRKLRDITNDPPPMCSAGPVDCDVFTWKGIIIGQANSPCEGGVFCLKIQFPSNYPFRPPKIYFTTPIYNPNINQRSYICLDSFRSQWSPIMTLSKLLLFISSVLCDPNPSDAFISSIVRMHLEDRVAYDFMARAWTRKYAM